jgi:hypothetical protein
VSDLVGVIESAYSGEGDTEVQWLGRVAATVRANLTGVSGPLLAWSYDVRPSGWIDLHAVVEDPEGLAARAFPAAAVTDEENAATVRLHRTAGLFTAQGIPSADAILTPAGRVDHATGTATAKPARESLREGVRAMERARGPLRRRDPREAVEVWRGLVAGLWSLVDHFDSDGRRYLVAHRNDPTTPDPRALTERERQIVAYADLGQSNKLIAYQLGLSASTVAVHLAHAREKLRRIAGGGTGS